MRASTLTLKRARRLRRKMTLPEVLVWRELQGCKLNGLRFRKQHPLGRYILDFYCSEARLCVEVGGQDHDRPDTADKDAVRDAWLAERGIRVLRLPARLILDRSRFQDVISTIAQAAAPSTAFGGPPPPLRG